MTVGEMLAFPYSNAFAMQRAKKGHPGEYMALYSIAFSLAHVFGHKLGFLCPTAIAEFRWLSLYQRRLGTKLFVNQ